MIGSKAVAVASTGFFTAAVAALEVYGTHPLATGLAIVGAVLALLEAEGRRWATRLAILTFNGVVGVMGGPIVAVAVRRHLEVDMPGVLIIASLVIGYVAHSALAGIKITVARRVADFVVGRRGK